MTNQDLFKQDDFRQQYELAKQSGDKRFGSECKHEQTRNGHCMQCLRKVVTVNSMSREYHEQRIRILDQEIDQAHDLDAASEELGFWQRIKDLRRLTVLEQQHIAELQKQVQELRGF